ncbi:Dehydrogenase [Seminavis robusta]|uniref:Dehydrogenase n=1 Tax=Seminavis robusta TaxID=568900 RepID=A0A9N8EJA7_9STRA|nr:Dehydrogenase [Seminavis robusta]|eukprot:Sro1089_g240110.1 Dehydrogenase (212) ;mRNA; r:33592-34227
MGSFAATVLGSIFLFWSIFSPQLQAYQRNWELRGGRDLVDPWIANIDTESAFDNDDDDDESSRLGLFGALFLGRIGDVCVVEEASSPSEDEFDLEDFADYAMEADELEQWAGRPYLLRFKAEDSGGRTLQVHARMSEEYTDIVPGQPVLGVMLSTSPKFTSLAALTDLFVPDLACWIGDYPYLNRAETEQLLATDDEIWELLQAESTIKQW